MNTLQDTNISPNVQRLKTDNYYISVHTSGQTDKHTLSYTPQHLGNNIGFILCIKYQF